MPRNESFFVEKGETVQKLEKNSLVYSIVTGENCRRSCNNNSRKGKAIPIKCLVCHRPTDPPPPSPPKKGNSRFTSQRSKYFNVQAHDLILLTTIGMM